MYYFQKNVLNCIVLFDFPYKMYTFPNSNEDYSIPHAPRIAQSIKPIKANL